MIPQPIAGVVVKPLRQLLDERGKVMHMLRADSAEFERFGEVYFSVVNPGAVKAWHLHKEMALNYAVPVGNIKMVLFDDREGSPTRGALMVFHRAGRLQARPRAAARVERFQGDWRRPGARRELRDRPAPARRD